MISCRTLVCAALVPEGQVYCDACGGLAQAKAEGLLDPKPNSQPKKFVAERPKGQAVAEGQGLARFTDPAVLADRRERNRKKRAKLEAARKAERLARGPKKQKKGGGGKKKGDDGGGKKGKKGKPDKGARKAARHGGVPTKPQTPSAPQATFTDVVRQAEVAHLTQTFEPAPPGVVSTPVKE